ncbi:MAG: DUF1801 domain-containing protein [Marinicella sp.]
MQKVEQFMQDIQAVSIIKYEAVKYLHELILQVNPEVVEDIKYGGLVFSLTGQSKLFCGIFVYRNHISIEFGSGSLFSDPEGLLEGKGQFRRHIKIVNAKDVAAKNVQGFIEQGIKFSS